MQAAKGEAAATRYVPELDGLRAVSILLVALSHAGLGRLVPGGYGVTVFFFISGYLITNLLLAELEASGAINWRRFYSKRIVRLAPALLLYIAVAYLTLLALGFRIPTADLGAAVFYVANYYEIFVGFARPLAETPAGDLVTQRSPFGIVWSLAIEEHFYIVFPLLLAMLRTRAALFAGLFALLVLPLIWRGWLFFDGTVAALGELRIYEATDTRLDSLAFGCLLAALMRDPETMPRLDRLFRTYWPVLLGIALTLLSLLIREDFFRWTARFSVQGVGLLLIVPALLWAERYPLLARPLRLSPVVYVGKLSYSLYLFHYLAFLLVDWFCASRGLAQYGLIWQSLAWPLAFGLAMASYHGVETPLLAVRRRLGSHAR